MAEEQNVKPEDTSFKNDQAKTIADLKAENVKLKDMVGKASKRKTARRTEGFNIVGFKGLKGFGDK